MKRAILFALLIVSCTQATAWTERDEVARLFTEAGTTGTFVLFDTQSGTLQGHHYARAGRRYVPASTFKIPNALIGLTTGAVDDVDVVLPYGGKPQRLKVWEKDMSLRQGMPVSNLPVYQALARRIGLDPMRVALRELGYGNARIADTVDDFWLVGPLAISAIEQARFMAKLAQQQLPVSQSAQRQVATIIEIEHGEGWSLHAKTGWASLYQPHVGWWVGWVERDGHIHAFALNIDMPDGSYARKRIELGRAALEVLDVLPNHEPAT